MKKNCKPQWYVKISELWAGTKTCPYGIRWWEPAVPVKSKQDREIGIGRAIKPSRVQRITVASRVARSRCCPKEYSGRTELGAPASKRPGTGTTRTRYLSAKPETSSPLLAKPASCGHALANWSPPIGQIITVTAVRTNRPLRNLFRDSPQTHRKSLVWLDVRAMKSARKQIATCVKSLSRPDKLFRELNCRLFPFSWFFYLVFFSAGIITVRMEKRGCKLLLPL